MTNRSKGICKLCLKTIHDNNYETLEGDNKQILEVLLLQVDIASNELCVICGDCLAMLQKCFEFKSRCLDVEDYITPLIQNSTKIDIGRMLQTKVEISVDNIKLCRLCIDIVKDDNCIHLDQNESQDIVEDIRNCLPELNISAVYDPLVCEKCINCLSGYSRFQKKCSELNFGESKSGNFKNRCIESNGNFKNLVRDDCNLTGARRSTDDDSNGKKDVDETVIADTTEYVKSETIEIKDELLKAVGYSPEKKTLKCDVCDHTTRYKYQLKKHSVVHKNSSEAYKCNDCEFKTKWKRSLQAHLSTHSKNPSEVKTHKCTTCNFTSKYTSSLKIHKLSHLNRTESKIYKCDQCDYTTLLKCRIQSHISAQNSCKADKYTYGIRLYKCTVCDYETNLKHVLNQHMLIHLKPTEKNMYKCDACGFSTHRKSALRLHSLVHIDLPEADLYKCNDCGFKSKWKRSLENHLVVHQDSSKTGIYTCNDCGFKSKWKASLRNHLLNHHNNPSQEMHKCTICNYTTKYKYSLKNHELRHLDPAERRIFKCNQCDYAIHTKYKLLKHYDLFHKNKIKKKV